MRPMLCRAAACAAALLLTAPSGASADRVEARIAGVVNLVRIQHGLPALRTDARLSRVSARHSRRMVRSGRLSHARFYSRRTPRGEVVGWMPRTGRSLSWRIVSAWLASPPHRATLLHPGMRRIGVGRRRGGGGTFVTADLTG